MKVLLRTTWRLLLIVVFLTYPRWDPVVLRGFYSQEERTEVAVQAERMSRANGELVRTPSGETRRAVVYTPGDPSGLTTPSRFNTWLFRVLALIIVFRLLRDSVAWMWPGRTLDRNPHLP